MNQKQIAEKFSAMAHIMPMNKLIDDAINALQMYKNIKTKEAEMEMSIQMQLVLTKLQIEEIGLGKFMSDFNELESVSNSLKNKGSN